MSYVHSKSVRGSWHSILTYTRADSILTRCGRLIVGPTHQLDDVIPLDQKSCETCLRLLAHDSASPSTDPVDPGPPNDEVPG